MIVDDAAAASRVFSIPEELSSRDSREGESTPLQAVRRAGAGDRDAQAWMVSALLPGVRRVARAVLRSAADADDAAQLAMLAILRSAGTYRGEAELEAWARRITARTVFKYLRARRQHEGHVLGGDVLEGAAVAAPAPSHEASGHDVRVYLDSLPELQREAITLHHALGYTVEEIAEITEASPNTVKSRIRVGIASLRERIVRRKEP
ncbi:RNA polymerase sigma factor [Pendulispora rubella]|uniref:RNA polymerase sigma factor n=1 Tax=Pendulispora rubella TaxID=2741070 RepID=A0ABZ2L2B2_9BACT